MAVSVPLAGHARLRLNSRSGKITVWCEARPDLSIERGASSRDDVVEEDGQLVLTNRSGSIEVRCPEGTDLTLGTVSGHIDVHGRAGAVVASATSGSIRIARALTADLRSVSGSVKLGDSAGGCRLHTVSGGAAVERTLQADVGTISGSVHVGAAGGKVRVKTASGRVEVGATGPHDVEVHTMSGSVSIRLPRGVSPATKFKSLSGRFRTDCPEGHDCQVVIRTVSGRAEVVAG